jgi:hypothetical protein
MAWSDIQYNPVPPADARGPERGAATEVKAAAWLRDLANDIEEGRVNMLDLSMDAFQHIKGRINVVLPKDYLLVGKVDRDEPTAKRKGKPTPLPGGP